MYPYGKSTICILDLFDFRVEYNSKKADQPADHARNMVKEAMCKCLEKKLEKGKELKEYKNTSCSILHLACALGRTAIVEGLITRGCDVNIRMQYFCFSPLYVTVLKTPTPKKALIMTKVLEAGSRVSAVDQSGSNAVHVLVDTMQQHSRYFVEWFKLLVKYEPDFRSCLYKVGYLPSGAEANPLSLLCTDYTYTNLQSRCGIMAVKEVLKYLHTNKYLQGFMDAFYYSVNPLDSAVESKDADVVELLLMNLKPPQMQTKHINNALMTAVQEGIGFY